MPCTIRPLRGQDEADWRRLWTGYLEFYQTTVPEESTLAQLVAPNICYNRKLQADRASGSAGLAVGILQRDQIAVKAKDIAALHIHRFAGLVSADKTPV